MFFKPQDLLFILVLILLLLKRDPRWFAFAGIICLGVSAPLFAKWIFFTAQRLVSYSFVFFLMAILLNLRRIGDNK